MARREGWGGARPGAGRKPAKDAAGKRQLRAEPKLPAKIPAEAKEPVIDPRAWAAMLPEIEEISRKYSTKVPRTRQNCPFRLPDFPKELLARLEQRKLPTMAMDSALVGNLAFAADGWLAGPALDALPGEGLEFLGYTFLSELAQRPEYRVMSETIADDATREWIDFDVVGDEKQQEEDRAKDPEGYEERMADPDERRKRVEAAGKADKVKALKDDQLRLEVQARFYEQCRNDGFFGRSHLFLDVRRPGADEIDPEELRAPIGDSRDAASRTKVQKGFFQGLKTIEPVWTYPLMYNAINPLRKDWYSPQVWFVMGQEIHGSRLQTFIGHPVPDMLKPAYAFGGISLSQMAKPYVDIWLQTRASVAQLIHSFSVMVLMTDLSTLLAPGNAASLIARVALFNAVRDNQGAFVVNKNTEDFKNVSASLSGLHELQAQSQEHVASVHRIPLVKFTGIQPAGLNASSEGEIKVYDDTIKAYQVRFMDPNLRRVINFQQLSLFGEVDPEITHRWQPLREITEAEKGQKRKDDADTMQKYVDMGAFSPGEVRKIAIEDEELPFTDLDPEDVPEPPAEEGLLGPGGGGAATEFEKEHAEGAENDNEERLPAGQRRPQASERGGGANDAADPFGATDGAEWDEGDHPRDEGGKFTSGGAGGGGSKGGMPDIPDFLKVGDPAHYAAGGGGGGQTFRMPQFGLTRPPWTPHQYVAPRRKPMPASEGKPNAPGSTVAFKPGDNHGIKKLNGISLKSWEPPEDWADVPGQADIDEPPLPELPKGMTMSTGVVIREKDGRVWVMRPKGGYGGYDQTFPKGGLEEGLSGQANAIKEAWEETGLKVRITGFAGDHEGDTTVSRFYFAERETGDPADAGWEAEGVILAPADKLASILNRKRDLAIAESLSPAAQPVLDPKDLKKVGGQMGSNEGGVFEDKAGNRFYVKRPQSKAHVQNELAAARLYQLAGVNTLNYREVAGGNHVATDLAKLDKNNVSKLSPEERAEAQKDFMVHAWLSNWDAAGTGGDNQGVLNGKVTTLDVGGSLRYRAQGGPKGAAFGPKVVEVDTMRDPAKSHDAAKLFGKMTDQQLKDSAERVTSIPDQAIRDAVGADEELADTLIARKGDIAKRFKLMAADEAPFDESKHPRAPDGKFTSGGGEGGGSESEFTDLLGEGHSEAIADYAIAHPVLVKQLMDDDPELQEQIEANVSGKQWSAMQEAFSKAAAAPEKKEATPAPAKKTFGSVTAEGKPTAFGGLYKHTGKGEAADYMATVDYYLKLPPKSGAHYRNMLKSLIENAKQHNLQPLLVDKLKSHLGQAWKQAGDKLLKDGKEKDAAKAFEKAKALGVNTAAASPPKLAPGQIKETKPSEIGQKKAAAEQQQEPKSWSSLEQIAAAAANAGKHLPPPTPQELEKAKKNVPLQMAYVPGAKPEIAGGAPMAAAEKLLQEFNAKYAGKAITDPKALAEKVNDFKMLGAGMAGLAQQEKAKQAEIMQAAKAAQAAKAKEMAAKAAAEAKAAHEKNKVLMDELGIGEDQAEGLAALAKMLGQSNADLALAFKSYEAKAKGFGYPISGIEAATIMSYSDGSYGSVNQALRSGKWTPAQHVYVSMVNKALQKMPKHTGSEKDGTHLIRNTHLTAEQIAEYSEGHIIQEKALMSTSTKKPNGVFSGNVRFVITSKGKRGASIKKLSHYGSEDEVIFAAKTFFKVNKVEKLTSKLPTGADTVIHLEEWEDLS